MNIPEELCIYRELNSNTKTCSSKEVLKEIETERRELIRQKFEQKRILEIQREVEARSYRYRFELRKGVAHKKIYKDNYSPDLNSAKKFTYTVNNISLLERDPKNKIGSISWGSLMSAEPDMKALLSKMDKIIKNQKDQFIRSQSTFQTPLKEHNYVISEIKRNSLAVSFGLASPDYGPIKKLLKYIEAKLPTKTLLQKLTNHQFTVCPHEFVGWISGDRATFNQKLHSVIKFEEDGKPKITIKLPEESYLLSDLSFVISYMIFPSYHRSQLNVKEENMNPFLFVEFASALTYIHNQLAGHSGAPSTLFPDLSLERLQTFVFTTFFERYTPQGRHTSDDPYDNSINLRNLISTARLLNLNKNIDVHYTDRPSEYRKSLKSMWYFLVFVDIMESLETGLPPKVEPSEITRYEDHTNECIESLITLNRVLYKYNLIDLDAIEDPDEFIHIIETEFIDDLKTLLISEYGPLKDEFQRFKSYDFEDTSHASAFVLDCCKIPLRFNIYSLMQTLYFLCYKKMESCDKYSKKTQKFSILSMKYASLIIYLSGEFFTLFDGLMNHPNCYDYGVLECVIASFPHLSLAIRRVYVCVGGRFFDGLHLKRSSAINNLLVGKNPDSSQLLKEIELKEEYQVLFSLEDLEDHSVDNDESKLFERYSMLLDHKHMIFSYSNVMRDIATGLFRENSNMKVAKFNHVVFYLLKLMSFFLNSSFTTDGSPMEKENLFMGFAGSGSSSSSSKAPVQPKQENEFNFGDLFEKSINTTSEQFDFKTFFSISQGLYQSSEIDQFLMGYSETGMNDYPESHSNGRRYN